MNTAKLTIFFFAFLLSGFPDKLFSQIRIDTFGIQSYFIKDGEQVPLESKFVSEIKEPTSMAAIKKAFRTFNFQGLESRFSAILWDEIKDIESFLRSYAIAFDHSRKTGLYENAAVGWGTRGNQGECTFYSLTDEIPNLSISYTYQEVDELFIVETIVITSQGTIVKRYPALYDDMKEWLVSIDLIDAQGNNQEKIRVYEEVVTYIERKLPYLNSVLPNPSQTLSSFQGSLSWFYNLEGNGIKAIKYAMKGLENYPNHVWINTNLALGYLLSGQIDEAKKIYLMHRDTPFRGGTLRSMFKQDILDLESNGVTVLGKEMVMELLK